MMLCVYQKALIPSVLIVLNRVHAVTIESHLALSTLLLPRATSTHIYQHKSSGVDLIAAFTDGLLERKTTKWQKKEQKSHKTEEESAAIENLLNKVNNLCQSADIRTLNSSQLDKLIVITLEKSNQQTFDNIVDQCVKYRILPSIEVVLRVLHLLSACKFDNANESTCKLLNLCETESPQIYNENIGIRPFRAQLLWQGGNCTESLELLKNIYKHENFKKNTWNTYRLIIEDTITNRGEAVMNNLVTHAEDILNDFNDATVLYYIWSRCFASEWFIDQQLAADLFQKYNKLRVITAMKTSILVYTLLQRNNVDGVHRFIEQVFLG